METFAQRYTDWKNAKDALVDPTVALQDAVDAYEAALAAYDADPSEANQATLTAATTDMADAWAAYDAAFATLNTAKAAFGVAIGLAVVVP